MPEAAIETNVSAAGLRQKECRHRSTAFDQAEIERHLAALPQWKLEDGYIVKTFSFANYHETLAFVNAAAWIIHAEDHHPELRVTYRHCTVLYQTHSVNEGKGGLSENDFICAAKLDEIFEQQAPRA